METVDLEIRVSELERKLPDQGAAEDKASGAADDSDLPLWWMRPEKGKEEDGEGAGNDTKA